MLPALPMPLVGMAGMDPARGGLVSQDVGKFRCVSSFKVSLF